MTRDAAPTYTFPAARNQVQMWLQEETQDTGSAYHVVAGFRLTGPVRVDALREAVATVVDRHEALRTVFRMFDGDLQQLVLPAVDVRLEVVDHRCLATPATELAREFCRRPFDRGSGPLLRAMLARVADDEHLLVIVIHHLVADGWSNGLITGELTAAYGALVAGETPPPLPPVALQYADYTLWTRETLTDTAIGQQVAFWRERLKDCAPQLDLPVDRPRPVVPDPRADTHEFTVPVEVVAALETLARSRGATLNMVLLGAFEVLLARYSGQERFVLGTVTDGRSHGQFVDVVGFFANMVPVRVDLTGRPTFGEAVDRVRRAVLDGLAHPDVPFRQLLTELGPPRAPGVPPLIQVTFQLLHRAAAATTLVGGVSFEPVPVASDHTWNDLALTAVHDDGRLRCGLQWPTALYDRTTVTRMADNLTVLLTAAAARPQESIWRLPLLSERERVQLGEWSSPIPTEGAGR